MESISALDDTLKTYLTRDQSNQVRRARAMTLFMRPLPLKSNEDHRAVYDAIRDGDPQSARDRHRAHRQHAREILIDLLKRHKLLQV